ncbi:hypothetical protein NE237_022340 [Protea cynaroides]|uniref:Uncharacterized protein n=1 Tax=Protea cynaroides TaxID=273540 RepID=A0A9Q0K441_9MAGN|nr:hypothetical protein NE237_022340 [Protea cynaroides]
MSPLRPLLSVATRWIAKNNNHVGIEPLQQQISSLPFSDQKGISEILYQALVPPTLSQPANYNADVNVNSSSSSSFLGSTFSLPLLPNFPVTSLSFDNNPSSLVSSSFTGGFSSPNVYNYPRKMEIADDPITTVASSSATAIATTVLTRMP